MDASDYQDSDLAVHDDSRFDCRTNMESPILCSDLKYCLLKYALNGADKVFMDRKFLRKNSFSNGVSQQQCASTPEYWWRYSGDGGKNCSSFSPVDGDCAFESRKMLHSEENGRVNVKMDSSEIEPIQDLYPGGWKHVGVSKELDSSSTRGYTSDFPLNLLIVFAVLSMKFVAFQFNLLVSFFTFPIWLSYMSLMFLMFPFQTLRHIKKYLMKKVLRMWGVTRRRVTKKAQQKMGNVAVRFGCAVFWSSYVCLILLGFLVSGFLFGGLMMRYLVVKPIQTTETLNFDYTKASPEAFVPLMPSSGVGYRSGLFASDNAEPGKQSDARAIPYNHKLQLTVSLMMPESEYNLKLGMFQVRVEFMSARGKVTASSRYPCMLRFKSQPIRMFETMIKSAPLIAGFQSESQILNIKMKDLTEGLEPTAFLRVTLEQRAEFKDGAGVPEIYAASLSLESDFPKSKQIIWQWRRTLFVWTSFTLFLTQLMSVLVLCRPMIMPRRGMPGILSAKKENLPSPIW